MPRRIYKKTSANGTNLAKDCFSYHLDNSPTKGIHEWDGLSKHALPAPSTVNGEGDMDVDGEPFGGTGGIAVLHGDGVGTVKGTPLLQSARP